MAVLGNVALKEHAVAAVVRVLRAEQLFVHGCGLLAHLHGVDRGSHDCSVRQLQRALQKLVEHAVVHLYVVLDEDEQLVLGRPPKVHPAGVDGVCTRQQRRLL